MLERGETTSQELTDLFLARIERHDPVLNAFRVVFDELARAEAAQADARRRSGDRRPLLGIPLAIKDDTDIAGPRHRDGLVRGRGAGARGLRGRAAAAQRGRRDPRQDARARDDDRAVHGVADLRHHPQPVGPAAHAGRLQRRLGGRGRGGPVLGGARLRRRRLDPHPGRLLRAVRAQAAARPRADARRWSSRGTTSRPGARSRAASPTARCFYDAIADAGAPPLAEAVGARARQAADRRHPQRPAGDGDAPRRRAARRAPGHRRPAALARARGRRARLPLGARVRQLPHALPARRPRRVRDRCRSRSGSRGAPAATCGSAG